MSTDPPKPNSSCEIARSRALSYAGTAGGLEDNDHWVVLKSGAIRCLWMGASSVLWPVAEGRGRRLETSGYSVKMSHGTTNWEHERKLWSTVTRRLGDVTIEALRYFWILLEALMSKNQTNPRNKQTSCVCICASLLNPSTRDFPYLNTSIRDGTQRSTRLAAIVIKKHV